MCIWWFWSLILKWPIKQTFGNLKNLWVLCYRFLNIYMRISPQKHFQFNLFMSNAEKEVEKL